MSPYRAAPSVTAQRPRRRLSTILRLAAVNRRRRLREPWPWNRNAAHVMLAAGFFALPLHGLPVFEPAWLRWAAALVLGALVVTIADVAAGRRKVGRMRVAMRKMRGTRPCHVCGAGSFEHCDAGLHS